MQAWDRGHPIKPWLWASHNNLNHTPNDPPLGWEQSVHLTEAHDHCLY